MRTHDGIFLVDDEARNAAHADAVCSVDFFADGGLVGFTLQEAGNDRRFHTHACCSINQHFMVANILSLLEIE